MIYLLPHRTSQVQKITHIEDERNLYARIRCPELSSKDQNRRFELRPCGTTKGGDLKYLVVLRTTPSARSWSTASDSQLPNSGIRDPIGGNEF